VAELRAIYKNFSTLLNEKKANKGCIKFATMRKVRRFIMRIIFIFVTTRFTSRECLKRSWGRGKRTRTVCFSAVVSTALPKNSGQKNGLMALT
jgi:hypothetical protein